MSQERIQWPPRGHNPLFSHFCRPERKKPSIGKYWKMIVPFVAFCAPHQQQFMHAYLIGSNDCFVVFSYLGYSWLIQCQHAAAPRFSRRATNPCRNGLLFFRFFPSKPSEEQGWDPLRSAELWTFWLSWKTVDFEDFVAVTSTWEGHGLDTGHCRFPSVQHAKCCKM